MAWFFFAARMIYGLPILFIVGMPFAWLLKSGVVSASSNLQDLAKALGGIGGITFLCVLLVLLIYSIILFILFPAILILFAREGSFRSCLKLREASRLVLQNPGNFSTACLINWAASLLVGIGLGFLNRITAWIPCIGWVINLALSSFSVVYLNSAFSHLLGQFGGSGWSSHCKGDRS